MNDGVEEMESIGRHFFMIIYIITLFFAIYVLTLNKTMLVETKKTVYKKLHLFYLALFIHIIINFIYFYKAYFISTWEWKIIILCAINTSLVLFICFGLEVLAEICHDSSRIRLPLALISGFVYVVVFAIVRIYFVDEAETFTGLGSAVAYIGSNGWFLSVGYVYGWRYRKRYDKDNGASGFKTLLKTITNFMFMYLLMNFFVDAYFGIAKVKAMVWDINLYHLSILIYLALNISLIRHFYTKDLFNTDKQKKKDISIDSDLQMTFDDMARQYHLTLREKEILQFVYQGKSSPEIAGLLHISANTVKRHLSNMYMKIGINSRIELIHMIKKTN